MPCMTNSMTTTFHPPGSPVAEQLRRMTSLGTEMKLWAISMSKLRKNDVVVPQLWQHRRIGSRSIAWSPRFGRLYRESEEQSRRSEDRTRPTWKEDPLRTLRTLESTRPHLGLPRWRHAQRVTGRDPNLPFWMPNAGEFTRSCLGGCVGTVLDEEPCENQFTPLGCPMQRRRPVLVLSCCVCAVLDDSEKPCEINITPLGRPMQRSLPVLILDCHVSAVLNENPCHFHMYLS